MIQRNKRSSRRSRPRKWSAHCCVVSRWRRRWSCTRHGFEGWGRKVGEALKREILLEMGPFGRGYPMITWQDLTYIWSNVCLYIYIFILCIDFFMHIYIYTYTYITIFTCIHIYRAYVYMTPAFSKGRCLNTQGWWNYRHPLSSIQHKVYVCTYTHTYT